MTESLLKFGGLLTQLQPCMTVVVPNDLLLSWFPSKSPGQVDNVTTSAATAFASQWGCHFTYFVLGGGCEEGDGRFRKPLGPSHPRI